jgi:hypothetical protein
MAAVDKFKAWFERDIRGATWDDNVVVDETDPEKAVVIFYTDTNEYTFMISFASPDVPQIEATVKPRKARAGQSVPRERNLFAGRLRMNERVWLRIMGTIVGLELVRIQRRSEADKAEGPVLADAADRHETVAGNA